MYQFISGRSGLRAFVQVGRCERHGTSVPEETRQREPSRRGEVLSTAVRSAMEPLESRVLLSSYTFTDDAGFGQGAANGVNNDTPGQLQLGRTTTPFPFINIAASGRGTMIRVDVNSG